MDPADEIGLGMFHASGGSPNCSPAEKSIVPIAPSAMTTGPASTRSSHASLWAPSSMARRVATCGKAVEIHRRPGSFVARLDL